jgi:hypothetical protein
LRNIPELREHLETGLDAVELDFAAIAEFVLWSPMRRDYAAVYRHVRAGLAAGPISGTTTHRLLMLRQVP